MHAFNAHSTFYIKQSALRIFQTFKFAEKTALDEEKSFRGKSLLSIESSLFRERKVLIIQIYRIYTMGRFYVSCACIFRRISTQKPKIQLLKEGNTVRMRRNGIARLGVIFRVCLNS